MAKCIVTVANLDTGWYTEFRGGRNPVFGLFSSFNSGSTDGDPPKDELLRACKMYSCEEEDASILVNALSEQWAGHEIKVFNLGKIVTRTLGELVEKKVSADGVLPF
jgi:hypothetical protein